MTESLGTDITFVRALATVRPSDMDFQSVRRAELLHTFNTFIGAFLEVDEVGFGLMRLHTVACGVVGEISGGTEKRVHPGVGPEAAASGHGEEIKG